MITAIVNTNIGTTTIPKNAGIAMICGGVKGANIVSINNISEIVKITFANIIEKADLDFCFVFLLKKEKNNYKCGL